MKQKSMVFVMVLLLWLYQLKSKGMAGITHNFYCHILSVQAKAVSIKVSRLFVVVNFESFYGYDLIALVFD